MALTAKIPPTTTDGPVIDGEETILTLYGPSDLKDYPYWKQLLAMVNWTFKVNHDSIWSRDVQDRFSDGQSFLDTLEPNFFTYILSSKTLDAQGNPRIYATASARTMVEHDPSIQGDNPVFRGQVRHIPGKIEAWELKVLAIDSALYKKGIGSMLQKKVESEIRKRARSAAALLSDGRSQDDQRGEIIYTLTTVAEVNEAYYLARGYKTIQRTLVKPMEVLNTKEFHLVHMEKTIAL